MSAYLPPLNPKNRVFNVDDFAYQNKSLTVFEVEGRYAKLQGNNVFSGSIVCSAMGVQNDVAISGDVAICGDIVGGGNIVANGNITCLNTTILSTANIDNLNVKGVAVGQYNYAGSFALGGLNIPFIRSIVDTTKWTIDLSLLLPAGGSVFLMPLYSLWFYNNNVILWSVDNTAGTDIQYTILPPKVLNGCTNIMLIYNITLVID